MVKWRTFINMTRMSWECEEKSIKRRRHENQKIPLTLSFSHALIIKG